MPRDRGVCGAIIVVEVDQCLEAELLAGAGSLGGSQLDVRAVVVLEDVEIRHTIVGEEIGPVLALGSAVGPVRVGVVEGLKPQRRSMIEAVVDPAVVRIGDEVLRASGIAVARIDDNPRTVDVKRARRNCTSHVERSDEDIILAVAVTGIVVSDVENLTLGGLGCLMMDCPGGAGATVNLVVRPVSDKPLLIHLVVGKRARGHGLRFECLQTGQTVFAFHDVRNIIRLRRYR